jgi:hypothetical protein
LRSAAIIHSGMVASIGWGIARERLLTLLSGLRQKTTTSVARHGSALARDFRFTSLSLCA